MTEPDGSRRRFVKAAYVVPAILTLPAAPEYAKAGSVKPRAGGSSPKPPKAKGPKK